MPATSGGKEKMPPPMMMPTMIITPSNTESTGFGAAAATLPGKAGPGFLASLIECLSQSEEPRRGGAPGSLRPRIAYLP